MKILRLTTSNDTVHSGADSRVAWIERLASERLGEPVEVVSKAVWPDGRLAPAVEKWLAEVEPDVVWFMLQSFWFEYVSVPKKLQRKFGRLGQAASEVGFKAAAQPRLGNTALFRAGRTFLQKTVGGDPHFTPARLAETVEDVAKATLRSEGQHFVVYGPFSYTKYAMTKRQERQQLGWRSDLIGRVRRLSEELHFTFEAPDKPHWQTQPGIALHGDRFHFAASEQKGMAGREVELLAKIQQHV